MKNKTVIIGFSVVLLIAALFFFTLNKTNTFDVPRFYVANAADGTVSAVDLSESEPVKAMQFNYEQLSHGIAQSPDQETLYIGTGFDGKSLLAVDVMTEEIMNEIEFDEGVHGIDIHPSGQYLYISLNPGLGNDEGGGIAVVDTALFEVVAFIETDPGPAHISVTIDGSQVWVANVNANTISVIDAYTFQVLASVPVGEIPNEVAVSPTLDFAYVANVRSNTISVIDMVTFEVVEEIEAGEGVHGVTVSPDGQEVWTANNHSNDVSVIDKETFTVTDRIETGSYANHISFSPDGNWAFVTHRESNDLAVIDRQTLEVIEMIPLGAEPHEMTLKELVTFKDLEVINEKWSQANHDRHSLQQSDYIDGIEFDIELLSPYNAENVEIVEQLTDLNLFDYYAVRLSLTTHSGDLNSINWSEITSLTSENGLKAPVKHWIVENGDSHHPSYLAVFEKTVDMNPLMNSRSESLTVKFSPFLQNEEVTIQLKK
ncbi:YncE family protein [Anaerobacillus sp. MEB173]|uniref:YncE family protein n=1 Tax=Anaerobacillus sp. MEB173 TaxID=3383345 RepID=UPI003F8EFD09